MRRFQVFAVLCILACLPSISIAVNLENCPANYPNGQAFYEDGELFYPGGEPLAHGATFFYPHTDEINNEPETLVWNYPGKKPIMKEYGKIWLYPNGSILKQGKEFRHSNGTVMRSADGKFFDSAGNATQETSKTLVVATFENGVEVKIEFKKHATFGLYEILNLKLKYDNNSSFTFIRDTRYDATSIASSLDQLTCDIKQPL
jgi:hypothetical protein